MDDLKELIQLVNGLPDMVLWILCGYLIYKLVVLGSIYGVLRLLIEKAHHAITTPKPLQISLRLGNLCLDEATAAMVMHQLSRLTESNYLHAHHAGKLKDALDKAGLK